MPSNGRKTLYFREGFGYNYIAELNIKATTEDNRRCASPSRELPAGERRQERAGDITSQLIFRTLALLRKYGVMTRYNSWQIIVCFGGIKALVFGVRNNAGALFFTFTGCRRKE